MIDQEVYRQGHQEQYRKEWMEKNRPAILQRMHPSSSNDDVSTTTTTLLDDDIDTMTDVRQRRKDQHLAEKDPQQYCADRCIATGNCDVFEDLYVPYRSSIVSYLLLLLRSITHSQQQQQRSTFCSFQLSPEDVIGFCNDCVLAEDEEPCDIPEAFYDAGKLSP